MMKSNVLRAVALSFMVAGSGMFLWHGKPRPKTMVASEIAAPAKTQEAGDVVMQTASAPLVKQQPVNAEEKSERETPAQRMQNTQSTQKAVVANKEAAAEEISTPPEKDPSYFKSGKMELNLGYALAKEPAFATANPQALASIKAGQTVKPEEISFPEGFRLSLRMAPRCMDIADSRFNVAELDDNGKALAERGEDVFVSATLKQAVRGNELLESLQRENCVADAGGEYKEELSAVNEMHKSVDDLVWVQNSVEKASNEVNSSLKDTATSITLDPYVSSGTGYSIMVNAGLADLFKTISSSEFRSSMVTFAVLDTGVYHHKDLSVYSGPGDDYGHGTMVAGAATALDNGIGTMGSFPFHARVASYKINIAGTGTANTSTINNAILLASSNGADVINVSWSGMALGSYKSAMSTAVARGSFCVGAGGNDGAYRGTNYTTTGSMAVGSLNGTNSSVASYSAYGPGIEIYTPGTLELTTRSGGYSLASGTSFASPLVGGMGLMIKAWGKAHGRTMTPATVESIIKNTASTLSSNKGTIKKARPLSILQTLRSSYN